MKKLLFLAVAAIMLAACGKNEPATESVQVITDDLKARVLALGFSPDEMYAADGGYIVENDIFISNEDLSGVVPAIGTLVVGEAEQYRTTNLVTGLPRVISVSSSGSVNANVSAAIDAAISRYNAQNLQMTFTRVASGGNINIKIVNGGNYIASAGFPTSSGNPYNEVKFNKQYQNWQVNTLASVFAHEIGHCIGFRHTDYMDRSYSCGGSYANEGASSVGAVHIPGTPTTADPNSWMLACIGNGINRPFNANDATALNYLY